MTLGRETNNDDKRYSVVVLEPFVLGFRVK